MKKTLTILLITLLSISLLAGCGDTSVNTTSVVAEKSTKPDKTKETFNTKTNTLHHNEFELKIKEIKKLSAGEIEFSETPAILVTYDYKNLSEEPKEDMTVMYVHAVQETDKTIETTDLVPILNDDANFGSLLAEPLIKIKKGESISSAVAFAIKYPDKPIVLEFSNSVFETIGKIEVK